MTGGPGRVGARVILRFGVLFPLIAGGILAASTFLGPVAAARERFVDGVAAVSCAILPRLGYEVRPDPRDARVLRAADGHGVRLAPECDGLAQIVLLVVATAVSPVPWRRRLSFAVLGALVLAALNQARIAHLLWLSQQDPDAFRAAHEAWWPAGLTLAAAALFLLWARRRGVPA